MLLYIVFDEQNQTYSQPLLAPDLPTAQHALNAINPENLNSLLIYPITTIVTPSDLLQLQVNKSLPIPQSYRSTDVTPSVTPQPKGVSSSKGKTNANKRTTSKKLSLSTKTKKHK